MRPERLGAAVCLLVISVSFVYLRRRAHPSAPAPVPVEQAAPAQGPGAPASVQPSPASVQESPAPVPPSEAPAVPFPARELPKSELEAAKGDGLVPWGEDERRDRDKKAAAMEKFRRLFGGGVSEEEARAKEDAFRSRLREAAARLQRDRAFEYAEITDLLLKPRSYAGRRVALLGVPLSLEVAAARPHFTLGDDFAGVGGEVAVSIAGFSDERKKELMRCSGGKSHAVALRGRVSGAPEGSLYVEAQDFEDLGERPTASVPVSRWLKGDLQDVIDHDGNRKALRAAIEAFRREAASSYVEVEDLALDPARYEGRSISTVGVPRGVKANPENVYLSLGQSFGDPNSVKVLATRLSLGTKKMLFGAESYPYLIVSVKGAVRRAGNGGFFLEAADAAGLVRSAESVSDILSGKQSGCSKRVPGSGMYIGEPAPREPGRSQAEASRDGLKDRIARLKGEAGSSYAELADIALKPEAYVGRRVAVLGVPFAVTANDAKPNFKLGDGYGLDPFLSVSVASFPVERVKGLIRASTLKPHVLLVRGRMARAGEGGYFIEAQGYEDLGEFPYGSSAARVSDLGRSSGRGHPDAGEARRLVESAIEVLRRASGFRYVELEDIVLQPQSYAGRNISTVGTPVFVQSNGANAYFDLSPSFGDQNRIKVLMDRLPTETKKMVFRIAFPPHIVSVKGLVRRSPNGAVYLEASAIDDIIESNRSVAQVLEGR